MFDHVFNKVII